MHERAMARRERGQCAVRRESACQQAEAADHRPSLRPWWEVQPLLTAAEPNNGAEHEDDEAGGHQCHSH